MSVRPASRPRVVDLALFDALRGLAALYVVLHHANMYLWESPAFPTGLEPAPGAVSTFLGYAFSFAYQPVLLFFLISGFCIHFRAAQALIKGEEAGASRSYSLDVRTFAWRRLRRLYPPFFVALLSVVVLDFVGSRLNPAFYAGQTPYYQINEWLGFDHTVPTFVGNLLMQSRVLVPAFGTNQPLWSLGYEFWFYALYPLLLLLYLRLRPAKALGVVLAVSLFGFAASRIPGSPIGRTAASVAGCWFIWASGALLAEAYVGRVRLPGLRLLAPLAVLGLIALGPSTLAGGYFGIRAFLWGCGLAVVLAYVVLALPDGARRLAASGAKRLSFLGAISYSLYLIHMPWLALLSALWLRTHDRLPTGLELIAFGALTSFALGVILWYLVERHFVSQRPGRRAAERPQAAPGLLAQTPAPVR